ncbi:MAG: hypothetical protein ABI609_02100 [Acidobacteriota bacterium]
MITGYNTDVRHGGVVFHVQTEDKGLANPLIESLVYVSGQVLAAKRAGYSELMAAGKGEPEIQTLMDHQHRVMIAAIKGGKFDDKLGIVGVPEPAPKSKGGDRRLSSADQDITILRSASISESERTLDQVILEYLTSEAEQEHLSLAMEEEVGLGFGYRAGITVRTTSSKSGQPVSGAQVTVKMISTVSHPRTLASGETNTEGRVALDIEIPRIDQGVAALIITAASTIGSAELKHLL